MHSLLRSITKPISALFFVVITISMSSHAEQPYSGTLFVVNKLGDDVSVIDIASRQIIKSIATGKGPHELAITEDGKWVVTTDYVGGNSLTVIDGQTLEVVRTVSLADFPRPHGILFFADQHHVAVSSEGSDSAVIVDIHSGEIVKAIDTTQKGSHMVAVPQASDKIFTTNMGSESVSVLDVESGKLERLIAMPETPEAVTVNKAGDELWVGSNKDGLVSIFNLADDKMLTQFTGYQFPYRILLTNDERFAVVPDYRQSTLDIFDVRSKKRLKRVQLDASFGPKGVTFHPDDRTLFLSLYSVDKVVAIRIPDGDILFEMPSGDGPDGIGYSALQLKK